MNQVASPREIVDRQLRAYNARDIDAYCDLYASDATIATLNCGTEHARGSDAIRAYYTDRFNNSPDLHCDVTCRIELGKYVVDRERVTGIGNGELEVIAIYEVTDSQIQSLRFIRK
jgi:hypothetical protein